MATVSFLSLSPSLPFAPVSLRYFGGRGVSSLPRPEPYSKERTHSQALLKLKQIVTDGHRTWKGLGISPFARPKEFSLWLPTPFALPPEVLLSGYISISGNTEAVPEDQRKEEDRLHPQVKIQKNGTTALVSHLLKVVPSSLENRVPWMLGQEP